MKILTLLFISLFSLGAYAEVDDLISELAQFNGGDGSFCNLHEYDPEEFNYRFELNRYRSFAEVHYPLDAVVYTDWSDILSMAENFAGIEWVEKLQALWHADRVRAMFGAQRDPEFCKDSAICRHADVRLFFKNNQQLECYFDL